MAGSPTATPTATQLQARTDDDTVVRELVALGKSSPRARRWSEVLATRSSLSRSISPTSQTLNGASTRERTVTRSLFPVTAIYSRNDAVVAWEACIDPDDPKIEHIEVTSSHFGMNLDPDVLAPIAQRLDQAPPG